MCQTDGQTDRHRPMASAALIRIASRGNKNSDRIKQGQFCKQIARPHWSTLKKNSSHLYSLIIMQYLVAVCYAVRAYVILDVTLGGAVSPSLGIGIV